MSRRRLIELLLVRWGFALLVAVAIAVGLVAAATVTLPGDIPGVALRAAVVYRVEVGASVFLGLYLAALAFALALQNVGFTEIGSAGFKARDLAAVSREEAVFTDTVADLSDELQELRAKWEVFDDAV